MRTSPATADPGARVTVPPITIRSPVTVAPESSAASPLITSSVPSIRPATDTAPLRTATAPRPSFPAGRRAPPPAPGPRPVAPAPAPAPLVPCWQPRAPDEARRGGRVVEPDRLFPDQARQL